MTKIIAFTGKMGSGKSEAIKALKKFTAETSQADVLLIKFAQPLYDIQEFCYDRISLVHKRADDFDKDRQLLQWLGTEWGRNTIDTNLWVNLWKASVNEAIIKNPNAIIVCDDCRFDNEASIIKSMDGIIVKILSTKNSQRIDTSHSAHQSEHGVSSTYVDCLIENNSSLDSYKNQLTYLFRKLMV